MKTLVVSREILVRSELICEKNEKKSESERTTTDDGRHAENFPSARVDDGEDGRVSNDVEELGEVFVGLGIISSVSRPTKSGESTYLEQRHHLLSSVLLRLVQRGELDVLRRQSLRTK